MRRDEKGSWKEAKGSRGHELANAVRVWVYGYGLMGNIQGMGFKNCGDGQLARTRQGRVSLSGRYRMPMSEEEFLCGDQIPGMSNPLPFIFTTPISSQGVFRFLSFCLLVFHLIPHAFMHHYLYYYTIYIYMFNLILFRVFFFFFG